ncbi:Phenoloxidase-activating factor 2 [Frankliniella fusca]|uniref:Phenoloxidase-activating factor 2 n=1 Tax=Frankliniella fusca TaxID=407009 RepID=A0AAE1HB16_9NEOP|nr:Phenoloxidase-activating factor 2 [Frankliniella fusca]
MRVLVLASLAGLLLAGFVTGAAGASADWSWGNKDGAAPVSETTADEAPPSAGDGGGIVDLGEAAAAATDLNADVIDDILRSGRQGRNLEGYDEVYADPNVQDALQNGNETSARHYIKDRLCSLGLSACDDDPSRAALQPQDLIYAQPVHIKPVGAPIAALPVRNPHAIRPYGPPRPHGPGPVYGRPPGPPRPQHYGPPPPPASAPGPYYPGHKVPPPPPSYEVPAGPHIDAPYAFESVHGFNKKKGGYHVPEHVPSGAGVIAPGAQQHVHHHFHHADNTVASLAGGTAGIGGVNSGINGITSARPVPVYEGAGAGLGGYGSSYAPAASSYNPATTGFTPGPAYPPNQAFYKKELNLKQPVANSLGGSSYGNRYAAETGRAEGGDCFCVPVEQCPAHEILRKEDGNGFIDPRNAPGGGSDILADDVVVTDENGTIVPPATDDGAQAEDKEGAATEKDKKVEGDAAEEKVEEVKQRRKRQTNNGSDSGPNGSKGVVEGDSHTAASGDASESPNARAISESEDEVTGRLFGVNNYQGLQGAMQNAQVQPTFGLSFGLPNQGAQGLYPLAGHGPFPLGNPATAGGGIDLGPIAVNPLVSVQVTKDQYGAKVVKPFVNLHVTPNPYLVSKFLHSLHNKHLYKHDHFHKHYFYHKRPIYKPVFVHDHPPPYGHHGPHDYGYAPDYHGYRTDDVLVGPGGPVGGPIGGPVYDHGPHGPGVLVGPDYPSHGPGPLVGPDYPSHGPGPLVGPDYPSHGPGYPGHPSDYPDTYAPGHAAGYGGGGGFAEPPIHAGFRHPSGGYVSDKDDQYAGVYRNNYNRSLSFPADGTASDPPRPPYQPSPLPLAKSDAHATLSKPVVFPSDRRSDRRRREAEPTKELPEGDQDSEEVEEEEEGRGGAHKSPVYRPQPQRGQCGRRQAQGINGRIKNPVYVDGDSEFGEYPWQVAILKKDPNESVYVCGGTLIDAVHIITAAHCIKSYAAQDLRVRLGEWDVNHDVEFYPHVERDVSAVVVHPEFYAGTLYNDLAIIRLVSAVDFSQSPHISPACLPDQYTEYAGSRCWTTGWGKDAFGDFGKYQNILKEVDVPVVSHQQCERQLQQTRLGYDFKLHQGFVCAGGEEGKDACKGDGGGPMVCERGGSWQVVGVVSWGVGCGQSGVPGVYVKVAHYLDWIRQVTNRF